MPPKSKGESKQGLIITLVFFILATIGLGVATYFGFAVDETKEKDYAQAKKDAATLKDRIEYFKFQSQIYRAYMGHDEGIDKNDLNTLKENFDKGVMKIGKEEKDKEAVTKLIKELDDPKRLGWNAKEKKPDQTYESLLAAAKTDYEKLDKNRQKAEKEREEAKATVQKRDDELKEAQKNYEANLTKFKNQGNKDQDDDRKTIDKLRKDLADAGVQLENARKLAETKVKTLNDQLKKKDADIKFRDERIKAQGEQIAELQIKSNQAPPSMRTDWKIVKMDLRGTNPYINLGSADRVKPQLTFGIHGVTLDGRPMSQPKGTLEVVAVVGEHLSRAHITSVKDPNRDPILEGDVLYNPSWNPTLKKHVALAGVIDLTGDGRDSLQEFRRGLERQNIIVDAWLDPKDGSIKGPGITVRTDYLILGESMEFLEKGREKVGDPKNADLGRKQMEAQAGKNGVAIVPLHKYLEMIGYRLPRSMGEERPSLHDPSRRAYSGERKGDKAPPAKMPDK
jgi:hypothetical protein